jgi:16S rRNA (adenine1518-N6/adenine1519-N6)-dimethyltransferase
VKPGEVRDWLARHGLQAHRDLGQNFLVDEGLAARLVDEARVEAGDAVVEIGTGLGILTRALAARAARVTTLEVDAGLVRGLRADGLLPGNVELVHADVLRVDLPALVAAQPPPVRVVANLPYSIASVVLRRLLDLRFALAGWAVMLQREVADRLLAAPGSRAYGSLAVLHQLAVVAERALDLRPGCFQPPPRVRSSFVRMARRPDSPLGPGELAGVERVVRAAFAHRRKTLANALRQALGEAVDAARIEEALARTGIDPRARAESVAPERLLALARALPDAGEGLSASPSGATR